MSLIPHNFFSRSMYDMDEWHRPFGYTGLNTLDLFDPFDEFDFVMGKNFNWLQVPDFMKQYQQMTPKYPQKYRIMVDLAGYDPKTVKTHVSNNKLIVTATDNLTNGPEDYSKREFKKTYDLPTHIETDKLTSFMTPYGTLVIELPLANNSVHSHTELYPKYVDQNGHKMVQMSFTIPENIDPSKVHVSLKDRDLIMRAEDRFEKPDSTTRFYYYKRSTLPENTDFDQLRCTYEKGKLNVLAPIRTDYKGMKYTPVTYKGHQYGGYPHPYGQQYGGFPQYGQYGQYGYPYQQPYYGGQQFNTQHQQFPLK